MYKVQQIKKKFHILSMKSSLTEHFVQVSRYAVLY